MSANINGKNGKKGMTGDDFVVEDSGEIRAAARLAIETLSKFKPSAFIGLNAQGEEALKALARYVEERDVMLRADAHDAVKTLAEAGESGLTIVRFLVESYYDYQVARIEALHRQRGALEAGAPRRLMAWLTERNEETELAIRRLLDWYTEIEPSGMGMWAREVVGIGPVISAGLLAYINMNIASNPSKIWRYFGLDPTVKWKKGEKRPWNASAKVLAWKIGDSFCKQHNHPDCFYGHLYAERKKLELDRDAAGDFAATAARTLTEKTFKDKEVRAVYESGHLPLGRLELRARRFAVKIFLSHWWAEAWSRRNGGAAAPNPWITTRTLGGHADTIRAPGKAA